MGILLISLLAEEEAGVELRELSLESLVLLTNHEALGNDIGKRDMGVLLISLLAEEEAGLELRELS